MMILQSHPLKAMTQELWSEVLEKMEDPLDRINTVDAFCLSKFNDKKVGWLFAVALPVIMKQLEWKHSPDFHNAFLDCRLVSRTCFKAIDRFVDEYWERESEPPPLNYTPFPYVRKNPGIHDRSSVCHFLNKIKNHTLQTCPIPTKHLHLSCYNERVGFPGGGNTNEILYLLEQIGGLLRSVNLYISVGFEDLPSIMQFTQRILPLLPNLRKLAICCWGITDDMLLAQLFHQPIPVPNLQCLNSLEISGRFLTRVIPLENYFSQVSKLELEFQYLQEHLFNGVYLNLEKLIVNNINDLHEEQTMEKLTNVVFQNLQAPQLKLLHMNMLQMGNIEMAEKNKERIVEKGIEILTERYPEKEWRSNEGFWYQRGWIVSKRLIVQLYNPGKIKLRRFKNRPKSICTIV